MKSLRLKWSDKADYGYAIGRVRSLETALLNRSQYERLVRAKDGAEFIAIIGDLGYSSRTPESATPSEDFLNLLSRLREENFTFFEKLCLDRWVVDLFRIEADVHNLKVLLKHRLSGTEPKQDELLGHGRWPVVQLARLVEESRSQGGAGLKELDRIAEAVAEAWQGFERTGDPALIDIRLDRLAQELAVLGARPSQFLAGYFSLHADLVNLLTLVRIRVAGEEPGLFDAAFLPGGRLSREWLKAAFSQDWEVVLRSSRLGPFIKVLEEGLGGLRGSERSFLGMERLAREMELSWLRRSRFASFGYEPLVTFYLWRENEFANLRRLYGAKLIGWSEKECRELVVYVE